MDSTEVLMQLAHGQALSQTGSFSWKLDTDEITFSDELHRIFEFDHGAPVTLERIASRVHPDDTGLLAARIDRARLADESFVHNAPAHVVAAGRERSAELERTAAGLAAQLERLRGLLSGWGEG